MVVTGNCIYHDTEPIIPPLPKLYNEESSPVSLHCAIAAVSTAEYDGGAQKQLRVQTKQAHSILDCMCMHLGMAGMSAYPV